jgi:hypothetical protein
VQIESVTSVAVISADGRSSRAFYVDALGLPLKQLDGDYVASGDIHGCNHFGVWPIEQAAEACFGSRTWPTDIAIPQVSIEFELATAAAVAAGVKEMESAGYEMLHAAKVEPWGQTVARLLSPEGAVVGLSYAPALHEPASAE